MMLVVLPVYSVIRYEEPKNVKTVLGLALSKILLVQLLGSMPIDDSQALYPQSK